MMPQQAPRADIYVPLHNARECADWPRRGPGYCTRAKGHTGRHAFYWLSVKPGRVRNVWGEPAIKCQVCGRYGDDGAVCRKCGG